MSAYETRDVPGFKDLEHSVRLLDSALGRSPGKSLLRLRQNKQRASNDFNHTLSPGTRGDNSLREEALEASIVGLASGRSSMTPASRRPLPQHSLRMSASNLDLSITLAPEELELINTQSVMNKTLSQGQWAGTCDKLYSEFLESLIAHGSEQQVFEIVSDFIQNCTDTLDILREELEKNVRQNTRQHIDQSLLWLENERNTWRLLYCLYQNRLSTRSREVLDSPEESWAAPMEEDGSMNISRHLSENDIVKQLYENDAVVRECQLVIDWLEKCAADRNQERGIPQMGHFTDKSVAWENTLHQLKNKAGGIAYGSSRPIVSKVDPDAPLRERKPLHDLDMEDEARLMHQVFMEIRCGRLESAQSLCYHCGQHWRAAVLEGWRLHHDPNYNKPITAGQQNGKEPIDGNPNRDIWKVCAWRMSEDRRLSLYARATQGALCGNLDALLATCHTWQDVLWAHLRVLVDVRVEKEIRARLEHQRTYADMPDEYWQNEMTLEQTFTALSSHKECRDDSLKPDHKVQELLIQERVGTLLGEMELWTQNCSPQMLRFLAHLVLVLRLLGHSDLSGDNVLHAYVKVLVSMREPRLVAHYVAQLPHEEQVQEYASFLATVKDAEERQFCLAVAEEAGLDIETITTTVVEMVRRQESMIKVSSETTASDLEKISALDWVVFYPSQRSQALWQANALMRSFLAMGKLEATAQAFSKIPLDSINQIVSEYNRNEAAMNESLTMDLQANLPRRVSCSIREYLCYKAYLDAQEGFSDWFQHFHHARPSKPSDPGSDAPFQERVAYDHRLAQYQRELEHWKKAMQGQTKTVRTLLYNVLLFPAGGWLVDAAPSVRYPDQTHHILQDDDEDILRETQLEDLRKLCIPKVVLLLHTVLHEMGEYAECVQLADLVITEQYQLYKVYPKEQLGELLVKIGESSLALLEQKKDPWGLPMSS